MSHAEDNEGTRRDFIYYATAGAGAVTLGAAVWPLVNQMNPSADVLAQGAIRVDVSGIQPGAQITVKWLGSPVFIRYRTEEELKAANEVDVNSLPDPLARNANVEEGALAIDANRGLPMPGAEEGTDSQWLVQMGVCTHLGCVPLGESGDFGGWFCPCHGSHYDTAGRIRKGPAPENLPVPIAKFLDESTILLGEEA